MKRDPAKRDPKEGKHFDGYKSHFESKNSLYLGCILAAFPLITDGCT